MRAIVHSPARQRLLGKFHSCSFKAKRVVLVQTNRRTGGSEGMAISTRLRMQGKNFIVSEIFSSVICKVLPINHI